MFFQLHFIFLDTTGVHFFSGVNKQGNWKKLRWYCLGLAIFNKNISDDKWNSPNYAKELEKKVMQVEILIYVLTLRLS